jgi:hypothetical protein
MAAPANNATRTTVSKNLMDQQRFVRVSSAIGDTGEAIEDNFKIDC